MKSVGLLMLPLYFHIKTFGSQIKYLLTSIFTAIIKALNGTLGIYFMPMYYRLLKMFFIYDIKHAKGWSIKIAINIKIRILVSLLRFFNLFVTHRIHGTCLP